VCLGFLPVAGNLTPADRADALALRATAASEQQRQHGQHYHGYDDDD
jgi:Holliday junction resolvasome RuvABC endonuclease subunit